MFNGWYSAGKTILQDLLYTYIITCKLIPTSKTKNVVDGLNVLLLETNMISKWHKSQQARYPRYETEKNWKMSKSLFQLESFKLHKSANYRKILYPRLVIKEMWLEFEAPTTHLFKPTEAADIKTHQEFHGLVLKLQGMLGSCNAALFSSNVIWVEYSMKKSAEVEGCLKEGRWENVCVWS